MAPIMTMTTMKTTTEHRQDADLCAVMTKANLPLDPKHFPMTAIEGVPGTVEFRCDISMTDIYKKTKVGIFCTAETLPLQELSGRP